MEHIKETRQADIKRADERYSGIKDDLKDISRKLDRLIQGDKGIEQCGTTKYWISSARCAISWTSCTPRKKKNADQGASFDVQTQFASQMLSYEAELMKAKADVIKSEAQGSSWIQRSWRPITMLTFLALVVLDAFNLLAFRLAEQAWDLLQIGLGGYVVGRSAEKIVPKVAESLKKVSYFYSFILVCFIMFVFTRGKAKARRVTQKA